MGTLERVIDLLEGARILQVKVGKDSTGIYCLQITTTDGDIVHAYADDDGSLSIEWLKNDRG